MSCTRSLSSNPCQRPIRSRSSSVAESTSPDSTSSDSHSSSDPDSTHLSSLSPWLQTPTPTNPKATFGMDVDAASSLHMMDLDSELSFDGAIRNLQSINAFQSNSFNVDDIVLSHTPTSTKSDVLMLEEIIKDGAFDPTSPTTPPYSLFPIPSPSFRGHYISSPSPTPQESQPQSPPSPICIDPSSTQARHQQPVLVVEQSTSRNSSPPESASVPSSVDETSLKPDSCGDSNPVLSYEPFFPTTSSNVVYPPKDACRDLPIFFPSVPQAGTKSRVETQIKLAFELCIPIPCSSRSSSLEVPSVTSSPRASSLPSSISESASVSPSVFSKTLSLAAEDAQQEVTYDRVGTYKYLRLPHGTTTKRWSATSASAKRDPKAYDADPQETLQMTADVVCCSSPNELVKSCASCQSREAKRTARKVAARVRPPPTARPKPKSKGTGKKPAKKVKGQELAIADQEEEADVQEPNVDGSILQFNCSEIVAFLDGTVILPMRITCYCRHHREKVGFNIVFTLRDHMGTIVGRGTTPPILITDDHKSTNVISKLPPMHPLRQALTPSTPPPVASSMCHSEETQPTSGPDQTGRAPTKRDDVNIRSKKRRPKPYDGRPVNRTVGVGPGIEGRQGVVLALHPAHARVQASTRSALLTGVTFSGLSTDTGPSTSRSSSSPTTRSPTPSHHEASFVPPSSVNGTLVQQADMPMFTSDTRATVCRPPSPGPTYQPTIVSSSSSFSSRISQDIHETQQDPGPPSLQSFAKDHQPMFDASSFSIYPSIPFSCDLLQSPKIHRLIPSSGPTMGGIEITVLGSNFHSSLHLECVFGGAVASSTHRWSDNTLVCVLPPRATPGSVSVEFMNVKQEGEQDEGGSSLFTYVDESDRQLMELALQVVGLKMTGKIEEARNVAMRIVGNTSTQSPAITASELAQMHTLSETSFMHHSFLGSLSGMDLETLIIKLLTLLDVPTEDDSRTLTSLRAINCKNATGQTLLHLAVLLALPSLVSCLIGRSIEIDAGNHNGLTPLHLAALTGWKEGIEILLAEGASKDVVDLMGLTPAQRAKNGQFEELEVLLQVHAPMAFPESESGDDGDDEARDSESEDSDDHSPPWPVTPQYLTRSRIASSTQPDSSLDGDDHSEPELMHENSTVQLQSTHIDGPPVAPGETMKEKPILDEKHDASFVERLQRTLPQGIIPNVQIPGFPQLQLPDMLAAPWGVLPQIPVFPVLVPIPNLPHLPNWPGFSWPDALSGEKKENHADGDTGGEKQQQPSFPMLWTAYDSLANSAWRAQWEKWTAQVTALQNANNRGVELPPYSPRREEKPAEESTTSTSLPDESLPSTPHVAGMEDVPGASTSRLSASKASRRAVYSAVKVSETEVESYHYPPKKQINKQDRMLVLFWIPILILGLAYAVYTTLPVAFAGIARATKRMLPQPLLQRSQV